MLKARYHVYDSAVIDASIAEAWPVLRDMMTLLPVVFCDGVKDCQWRDGGSAEKIPSRFAFTFHPSGASVVEEVVARSETEHSVTYRMIGDSLGIEGYEATYRLLPITSEPGRSFLEWLRAFSVVAGADPEKVVPFIAGLTATEVATIKTHFAKARSA